LYKTYNLSRKENDTITNRKSTRDGTELETKEMKIKQMKTKQMKTKPLAFLLALTFYLNERWIFI